MYGTLAPGEVNHHAVATIGGSWHRGVVRGYLFEIGWGPAEGYPGFVADPDGHRVEVMVLVSDRLASNLRRLDDFEGPGYRRRPIAVADPETGEPMGDAQIFEALTDID